MSKTCRRLALQWRPLFPRLVVVCLVAACLSASILAQTAEPKVSVRKSYRGEITEATYSMRGHLIRLSSQKSKTVRGARSILQFAENSRILLTFTAEIVPGQEKDPVTTLRLIASGEGVDYQISIAVRRDTPNTARIDARNNGEAWSRGDWNLGTEPADLPAKMKLVLPNSVLTKIGPFIRLLDAQADYYAKKFGSGNPTSVGMNIYGPMNSGGAPSNGDGKKLCKVGCGGVAGAVSAGVGLFFSTATGSPLPYLLASAAVGALAEACSEFLCDD